MIGLATIQAKLVVAAVVATVGFGAGYKTGIWRGEASMEKRVKQAEKDRAGALKDLAELQAHFDGEVLKRRQEAQMAAARQLELEAKLLEATQDARKALDVERARTRAVLDRAARAERVADGLRGELAAFAAGAGQGAADTVSACHERATAIGDVLDACVRIFRRAAVDLAGEAEDRAAEVRSLQRAYPTTQGVSP